MNKKKNLLIYHSNKELDLRKSAHNPFIWKTHCQLHPAQKNTVEFTQQFRPSFQSTQVTRSKNVLERGCQFQTTKHWITKMPLQRSGVVSTWHVLFGIYVLVSWLTRCAIDFPLLPSSLLKNDHKGEFSGIEYQQTGYKIQADSKQGH